MKNKKLKTWNFKSILTKKKKSAIFLKNSQLTMKPLSSTTKRPIHVSHKSMICFVCFMEINCSIVQSSSYFLLCSLYCSLSISVYIFILIVCFLAWSCTNKLVGIANLQFLFLFNSSPTPPPSWYSILYFFYSFLLLLHLNRVVKQRKIAWTSQAEIVWMEYLLRMWQ